MEEKNVLKVSEAIKYLGVGKDDFKRMVDGGKIKYFTTFSGKQKRFPKKYLDEFIDEQCNVKE